MTIEAALEAKKVARIDVATCISSLQASVCLLRRSSDMNLNLVPMPVGWLPTHCQSGKSRVHFPLK